MNRDIGSDFAAIFESSQRDAQAIMRGGARPLSRADENKFYGEALTASAIECGRQAVCSDMELVAEFLNECSDAVIVCDYFAGISTPRLVSEVLLSPASNDAQLAAAAKEFRIRLLAHFKERVLREAEKAMQP